jgi:hypothetical protein
MSPRDSDGDGTHTASTTAGNVVRNASLYGLAEGNAWGGVVGSRLAVVRIKLTLVRDNYDCCNCEFQP